MWSGCGEQGVRVPGSRNQKPVWLLNSLSAGLRLSDNPEHVGMSERESGANLQHPWNKCTYSRGQKSQWRFVLLNRRQRKTGF